MTDVTQILSEIEEGDSNAAEQLLPLVYDELKKLAAAKLAIEKPGQTLQPTALVHDAYIRLVDVEKAQHWDSRGHFFAAAAEAMRRILVDNARRKKAIKHGGQLNRVSLSAVDPEFTDGQNDLLELDDAICRFEEVYPRQARLVKLRFFGGLTIEKAAEVVGISHSTADADWAFSRGWLKLELRKNQ